MGTRARLLALVVTFSGIGCGETLPFAAQDTCGARGMELAGINMSEGRSQRVSIGGGIGVSNEEYEGTSIQCVPPPDNRDRYCQVEAYRARAAYKLHHEWITSATREKLVTRAEAVWEGTYKNCMAGTTVR